MTSSRGRSQKRIRAGQASWRIFLLGDRATISRRRLAVSQAALSDNSSVGGEAVRWSGVMLLR